MKVSYLKRWSKGIRLFLVAAVIAFIALTTIAIPVTHASGGGGSDSSCDGSYSNCDGNSSSDNSSSYTSSDGTAYTESYDSSDQVTCNEFHYLGGTWPARFHLGGCVINNMKQYSWTIKIAQLLFRQGLAGAGPVAFVTANVVAIAISSEIDHVSDESNSCNGTGIYIDFYGGVYSTHPTC